MTRAFTPAQRFRILIAHTAVVIVNDALVPVSQFKFGTLSDTRRFAMLRRLNCAVLCSCGCDTWAPLWWIDFHHLNEHANGGATVVKNGAPLRRQPCHAGLSAAFAAITGKVTRTRRKLSVTTGLREDDSLTQKVTRTRKRSWPQRSFPKSSRQIPSRPFQKRWEPRT